MTRAVPARVAVVITAYNRADTVGESIESVLAQTCTDFELCVVDDGSTDHTREVARAYCGDERVHYLYKPNGGQASALNRGVAATSAPLISFLDSDCRWLPRKLEAQLAAMQANPGVGVLYSDNRLIDVGGTPGATMSMARHSGWITRELLYDNFVNFNCCLVRREHLDAIGGFDESLDRNPDYDAWLRLSTICPFLYLPGVLAEYRIMPGQLSSDKEARLESNRRIIARFLASPECGLSSSEKRRAWAGFFTRRGRSRAARGELGTALSDLVRALCRYPLDTRVWRALARLLLRRTRPDSAERRT